MKEKNVTFTEKDVAEIMFQLLAAINYIHTSGLVHRDLKLENIMVDIEETEDG